MDKLIDGQAAFVVTPKGDLQLILSLAPSWVERVKEVTGDEHYRPDARRALLSVNVSLDGYTSVFRLDRQAWPVIETARDGRKGSITHGPTIYLERVFKNADRCRKRGRGSEDGPSVDSPSTWKRSRVKKEPFIERRGVTETIVIHDTDSEDDLIEVPELSSLLDGCLEGDVDGDFKEMTTEGYPPARNGSDDMTRIKTGSQYCPGSTQPDTLTKFSTANQSSQPMSKLDSAVASRPTTSSAISSETAFGRTSTKSVRPISGADVLGRPHLTDSEYSGEHSSHFNRSTVKRKICSLPLANVSNSKTSGKAPCELHSSVAAVDVNAPSAIGTASPRRPPSPVVVPIPATPAPPAAAVDRTSGATRTTKPTSNPPNVGTSAESTVPTPQKTPSSVIVTPTSPTGSTQPSCSSSDDQNVKVLKDVSGQKPKPPSEELDQSPTSVSASDTRPQSVFPTSSARITSFSNPPSSTPPPDRGPDLAKTTLQAHPFMLDPEPRISSSFDLTAARSGVAEWASLRPGGRPASSNEGED